MNCVRHEGERFQPVEAYEALAHRATDSDALRDLCVGHARLIEPAGFDAEGRWLFLAVLCYRQAFFAAGLALTPDGQLEMIDDRMLAEAPARSERMEGLFSVLEAEETR